MVTTTTVFTIIAIALLGNVLITQVRDGLLDGQRQAALDEAATGTRTSQEAFDSADRSEPAVYDTLVPDLVRQLSRGGGPGGAREVVLLRGDDVTATRAPLGRSSAGVDIRAVPQSLREQVEATDGQQWTYSEVTRANGQKVPVMVVGSPVVVPRIGEYELYYLFPLDRSPTRSGWSATHCSWPRSAC